MTIIVGAGPAGLAAAARLRERDLPFRLIDAGHEVGGSWAGRYDSLRLHTARFLSALPGMPIPKQYGDWVARNDLVAYLREYARARAVPQARRRGHPGRAGGWRLAGHHLGGNMPARAVVIATGYSHTPYLPDWPDRSSFTGRGPTPPPTASQRPTSVSGCWWSAPATRRPTWSTWPEWPPR